MSVRPAEYGSLGLFGIGTPQANPTVEHEFALLRPPGVSLVTARLFSESADSRTRLDDYLTDLGDALRRFDTLRLDAFGFACTGSSYLREPEAERDFLKRLEDQFGYPIVTAAAAIEQVLNELDARRILIIAPYPQWLGDLGAQHWKRRGFEVTELELVSLPSDDTRHIYELTSDSALDALLGMNYRDVDALLFSGTGMPSLNAIRAATEMGLTALSSNLCLTWALLHGHGLPVEAPARGQTLLPGWEQRLDAERPAKA
jgi:maleate isomerase